MCSRAAALAMFLACGACESQPLDVVAAGGAPTASEAGAGAELGGASGLGGAGGASDTFVAPEWLSETGLFSDVLSDTLAEGVRPFTPQFELWSDGADKRRWLWLPPGETIDTSNMNYWRYPVGTKVWKEFSVEGRRIETRLLQKIDSQAWFMMAFRWNGEATDAVAVPDGEENARSKQHDIPSTKDCATCHEKMPDVLLGVTALQLSHADGDGVTIDTLTEEGVLSDPIEPLVIPGSAVERDALGYLHANCGMCHHPESDVSTEVNMELWLRADELDQLEDTGPYRTAVGQPPVQDEFPDATSLIEPGDAEHSAVILRMSSRDEETQMPPLGSEVVDPDGLAKIQAWITALGQ